MSAAKRSKPVPMERYRHFKGQEYQILNLAIKEDTGEILVIYQALYGEFRIYARELNNFLSEVDHAKYPAAGQQYRFEKIEGEPESTESGADSETIAKHAEHAFEGTMEAQGDDSKKEPSTLENADAETQKSSADDSRRETGPSEESSGKELAATEIPAQDAQNMEQDAGENLQLDPMLERFLDAASTSERLDTLERMRSHVTKEMIDTMAVVVGVEVAENDSVQVRYDDLHDCLLTIQKYELERGRLR